jgi:alginate O-acetyltransferase complex protein AlgI
MLFNSVEFFIFFPVVTLAFFALPHRFRWFLLLVASCYFYMRFIPVYILILFFTILVDYVAGIVIEKTTGWKRKLLLLMSILANIGVLVVFKYFNFLNTNFSTLFELLDWNYPIAPLSIILPIGLSFHTFQSISYTVEVYRRKQEAERHLGIFALYVMFYPQLVAGPIERPQNMLHQYHEERKFSYENVTNGLKLMAWGLFKKVVIADRMAVVANQVFGDPSEFNGIQLIIGTVCFAYQIYCDFSGYSDIAIGAAQVMGYKFMDNFRQPYASRSISEFWKRWHISLSTWFRDYLYIPLGGNRVPQGRWQLNLFITFLVSGLWHGASWTFVIWGGLHGFYLVASLWTQNIRAQFAQKFHPERFPTAIAMLQTIGTFSLVTFAWIFFRAASVQDAFYIAAHLFSGWNATFVNWNDYDFVVSTISRLGYSDKFDWIILFAAVIVLEGVQFLQRRGSVRSMISTRPAWQRWALYYAILLVTLSFGIFDRSQFIYFQF